MITRIGLVIARIGPRDRRDQPIVITGIGLVITGIDTARLGVSNAPIGFVATS